MECEGGSGLRILRIPKTVIGAFAGHLVMLEEAIWVLPRVPNADTLALHSSGNTIVSAHRVSPDTFASASDRRRAGIAGRLSAHRAGNLVDRLLVPLLV